MTKLEQLALAATLTLAALAGGYICFLTIEQDYKLYQMESECVRKMQMANYSRKEILTGNGTCWIRQTGEYDYVD